MENKVSYAFNRWQNRSSNILNELEKEINKHFAKVGTVRLNSITKRGLTMDTTMAEYKALDHSFLQKRH